MNKNYVLIDYENVQPEAMTALEREHFSVFVFVGANQAKVSYETASVLQRMGDRARYIKIAGNGSNALDFHIAYYIGELAAKEPDARFHIVSKDTGFDPLIQHLKNRKVSANRVKSISDLPLAKTAAVKSAPDRVAAVVANLKQRGASNPRTLKTLASTINALFQKSLSAAEVERIISELKKKGVVVVNQTKVSYSLPSRL
ncbi:MAG: PIN domain-containing protein [Kiritimatiellales bacterium]